MYEIGEIEQIIRPDGLIYDFEAGVGHSVLSIGGRGLPPVEYQTMRGYMQQSETVVGWQLRPRLVTLTVSWENVARENYWTARQELMQFIRPNLGGDLVLRHTRADGTQRDIKVRVDAAVFENDQEWAAIDEPLTFVAHDPTFFDPTQKSVTFTAAQPSQLAFPITFPITFSSETMIGEAEITYGGDFAAWPIIDITGPYTWVQITNVTTGKLVKLGQPILEGQTRRIDLNPNARSIIDGSGGKRFNELIMPDSDLLGFNLRPDGLPVEDDPFEGVPGGVHLLRVDTANPKYGTTQVVVRYHERFVSVA